MRWPLAIGVVSLLLPLWPGSGAWGRDGAEAAQAKPKAGITVWDTGQPSENGLAPAALAGKNDWTVLPPEQTAESFRGDAVLSNGRIAVVLRRHDSAVELHGVKSSGAVSR